jgi:hypothetical protein
VDGVEQLLLRDDLVVVHGYGRSMTWLKPEAARDLWRHVRPHFDQPGTSASEPDAGGLRYAASLWRSGQDRLLGVEVTC